MMSLEWRASLLGPSDRFQCDADGRILSFSFVCRSPQVGVVGFIHFSMTCCVRFGEEIWIQNLSVNDKKAQNCLRAVFGVYCIYLLRHEFSY